MVEAVVRSNVTTFIVDRHRSIVFTVFTHMGMKRGVVNVLVSYGVLGVRKPWEGGDGDDSHA